MPSKTNAESETQKSESVESELFANVEAPAAVKNIDAFYEVELELQVVMGTSRMTIQQLLALSQGSVVELDRRIGEPVDVMINGELVARGDMVKVNENQIGVNLTKIVRKAISDL